MKKMKKVKANRILTPIIFILLFLFMHMILNFNMFTYANNKEYYKKSEATIVKQKTDSLTMKIPMVQIEYDYKGKKYCIDKYYVLEPLFGLSNKKNTKIDIYINTLAPNHALIKTIFFKNILNYIFLILEIVSICNLVFKIKNNIKYKKERKRGKQDGTELERKDKRE